jgi:uncharacterized membrane protein
MSDQFNINDPNSRRESEVTNETDALPGERSVSEVASEKRSRFGSARNRNISIVALVVIFAVVAVLAVVLWGRDDSRKATEVKVNTETAGQEGEHSGEEVKLSPEALAAAGIEIEG